MLALLASLILVAEPPPAGGSLGENWGPQQDQVRARVRSGRAIPLDQATAAVARRIPGRLLDAGLEAGDNGREVYRIRWAAADGRRLDVIVDAATGAVLHQGGG